jgi:hypothetical protein
LFLFKLVFVPHFLCVGVEGLFAISSTINPFSSIYLFFWFMLSRFFLFHFHFKLYNC